MSRPAINPNRPPEYREFVTRCETVLAEVKRAFPGLLDELYVVAEVPPSVVWSRTPRIGLAVSSVPAACLDTQSDTIYIHPSLHSLKAPMYVIAYLVRHEAIHYLMDGDGGDGGVVEGRHSEDFWRLEMAIPKRDSAITWLNTQSFPTLPIVRPVMQ